MPSVYLNNVVTDFVESMSLKQLLMSHGYTAQHFAVAINGKLIPRISYENRVIEDGDHIDIITPMQGG